MHCAAAGRASLHDLASLLTTQHNTPLAALELALPCPSLLPGGPQQAQQADARVEHHSSEGSGRPFTASHTACLSPGVAGAAVAAGRYAESVVVRGPRARGAALDLAAAAEALDAALLEEAQPSQRCVQQRTLAAQPLALPLPFPRIFSGRVTRHGDWDRHGSRAAAADVVSCPVLSRLCSSTAFGAALQQQLLQFQRAASAGAGQAVLEAWGHGREEQGELAERLRVLAHAYDPPEE